MTCLPLGLRDIDANMTTNRVISFKSLDTVTRADEQLSLGAATKTELWNRPEAATTTTSTEAFKEAVVGSTQELPTGTAKVVWRWVAQTQNRFRYIANLKRRGAKHNDQDPHFAAVCLDSNDKYLGTEHFTRKK